MEVKGSTTLEMTGVLAYYYPAVGGEAQNLAFPHTCMDRFSVSLQLMSSGGATVRASHELRVLDPSAILPPRPLCAAPPRYFLSDGGGKLFSNAGIPARLPYMRKVVLAMRSPVFKAELFGEMKENGTAQVIVIDDVKAATFRALLRYIYTDASPAAITSNGDNRDEGDDDTRVWELLTAADRYDVQRLKLICERVLSRRLDVENVADTLALADQHHCDTLKDACIEFMTTSQRMGQVAATQGYMQLKIFHPHLVFEVLEKSSNFHKHVELML
ncbi:unnamed protein product [Urochloa decumbens]|uniref:BTB domain-containing protein n=1 Tax=Urochloa decumbens TaxID=240449 RepID=A0ABC9BWC7_9POAL